MWGEKQPKSENYTVFLEIYLREQRAPLPPGTFFFFLVASVRENIPSRDVWKHLGEGKGGLDFIEPFAVRFKASVSVQGGGVVGEGSNRTE